MAGVFYGASAPSGFDQDISSWNTACATSMAGFFYGAYAFNQDISSWNVARVGNMLQMFHSAKAFDQNIGAWNTASVSNMVGAFNGASAFNQNIAKWTVNRVTDFSNTFENVGLQGCYKRYIREAWGSTFQKAYGLSSGWLAFVISTWYSTDRSTFLGLTI
jgi:surface protein